MQFRITDGYLHEFVKENQRGTESASNKQKIGISAGSKSWESTVPYR